METITKVGEKQIVASASDKGLVGDEASPQFVADLENIVDRSGLPFKEPPLIRAYEDLASDSSTPLEMREYNNAFGGTFDG
jgi:hypothetical protein